MKLIAYKPNINSPEWHGAFIHISQFTEMNDIEMAVSDHYDEQGEEEIELRVYNETSNFKTFSPNEKNHIGFIKCKVLYGCYQYQHLTTEKQPISYKKWDACKFYQGQ